MGAVSSIVINDAQTTPVAHTFIPLAPDAKGVWWFEDQSPASPIGYKKISLSLTRPPVGIAGENSNMRNSKVTIKVWDPVLDNITNSTISGVLPAPSIAYVEKLSMEFVIPERATLQNRKDMRAYALGLLANANVVLMLESLQPIY